MYFYLHNGHTFSDDKVITLGTDISYQKCYFRFLHKKKKNGGTHWFHLAQPIPISSVFTLNIGTP